MFKRLSKILRVPLPRLTKALEEGKDDPLTPILVKTAVHEDQVMTARAPARVPRGLDRRPRTCATTRTGAGAQVLGYVGEISPDELERLEQGGLSRRREDRQDRRRGGVRHVSARQCRRRAAPRRLARHPQGGFEPGSPAQPGNNVRLTIDVGLQRAAERAIRDGIELARGQDEFNANGGAIVALDPRDGAVLAMASNPTYKPSVYVGRVDPKKLEPLTVEKVAKERNYPGHQPRDRRRLPARLDLQAAHGAGRDLGRPALAYEYIQCTPSAEYGLDKHGLQQLEPVHERADVADDRALAVLRHLFYDVGNRYYTRGEHERKYWTRCRPGRGSSGSAAPGLDIGGEGQACCRRPPGASASHTAHGTRPGTRAT